MHELLRADPMVEGKFSLDKFNCTKYSWESTGGVELGQL
jgi:hypothetical protein